MPKGGKRENGGRKRDTNKWLKAGQVYGAGARVFLTRAELAAAFGREVGQVWYRVKPWGKRTIIIRLSETPE